MIFKQMTATKETTHNWRTEQQTYTVSLEQYSEWDGVKKYLTYVTFAAGRRRNTRVVFISGATDNNITALADYLAQVAKYRKDGWQITEKG